MATYDKKIGVGTLVAAADLSAKLHHLAKIDASGEVAVAGAGELAVGTIGNKPLAGEPVELDVGVIVPVVAGAAVASGAEVAADANGRAVTATVAARVFGVAIDAAAADGEEIRVLVVSKATA